MVLVSNRIKSILRIVIQDAYFPASLLIDYNDGIKDFWRTLLYNRALEDDMPSKGYGYVFHAPLCNGAGMPYGCTRMVEYGYLQDSAQGYVLEFLARVAENLLQESVYAIRSKWYIKGKAFVIKRGLLRMVELHAKCSDLVCVFLGCEQPLLVAPLEGRETSCDKLKARSKAIKGSLHGCAYIYGYMDSRETE